ncbi:MAG: uspA12 [Myxococcaceae bacterium]|nr:uspA12 [Myxococcaceae bacterium]
MAELKKVLCPVDLTPQAASAVTEAASLAESLGAELLLLHVMDTPTFGLGEPILSAGLAEPMLAAEATAFTQPALIEEYQVEMNKRLTDLGNQFRSTGLPVSTLLVRGATPEAIVSAADDAQADLIVMSTHGRTGLSHFLLGSVTERVVRTAKVPVMTLRLH